MFTSETDLQKFEGIYERGLLSLRSPSEREYKIRSMGILLLTELHLPLRVTLLLGSRGSAGPMMKTPSASGHVLLCTWRAIHINASLSYCLLKATPLSSLSRKSFSPQTTDGVRGSCQHVMSCLCLAPKQQRSNEDKWILIDGSLPTEIEPLIST